MFKLIVRSKDVLIDPKSRLEHDYAMGIKSKPIKTPEPEVIYLREDHYETDWGTVIGVGLLGIAVGAAIGKRQKKKRNKR
jgi:hypothetical protein